MNLSVGVLSAVALVVFGGCSSSAKSTPDSTPSTTVASSKGPVCTARSDLTESVQALTTPSLLTTGKPAIQSAVDEARNDLDALSSAATATYKPQIDAVQGAIDELETALSAVGDGSASANARAMRNAAADIGSATANLVATLETDCP